MKKHETLRLDREERAKHTLSAAFLPGQDPLSWLGQLSEWGIPLLSLRCFLVPKSRAQPETTGLFVLFPNAHGLAKEQVQYPYGNRGRLWLPLYTDVQPAVTDAELEQICAYRWQFFHPSTGFVGYQAEDELDISQLLLLSEGEATRWDKATAAPPPNPLLRQLNPPQVSSLDFVTQERQSIGEGSEEELLDEEEDNSPQAQLLKNIRDFAERNGQKKLADWAQNRLRELARKRKNTVERLKDMLEKDPMKALKYAPPLSEGKGNHRGRGRDAGDSTLVPRNIDFNLGRLGGGSRASSNWHVNNHDFSLLRQQYYQLAIKLIEAGELRKAAYIYAHLLEDYSAAANVLKQGGFYLEAAALFREKLNNRRAEAECLSEGQYFLQAAEVYATLGKWLEAAPLFTVVGETDRAKQCYEKAVDRLLKQGDYLNAAKMVEQSLKDRPRATEMLLEGWRLNKQPEGCLLRYFQQLPKEELGETAQVLSEQCSTGRYESFLSVVLKMNPSQLPDKPKKQLTEIGFRLVSTLLKQGKKAEAYLTSFLPDDKLLPIDLQRLNDQRHKPRPAQKNIKSFSLNQQSIGQIDWIQLVRYYNFILALGYMGDHMILARSNKEGYAELKDLGKTEENDWAFLINRTGYDETTYLATPTYSSESHTVQWPMNVHFPLMNITFLGFLPFNSTAVGIMPNQNVLQIECDMKSAYLQHFSTEGALISKDNETLVPHQDAGWNEFHSTNGRRLLTTATTASGAYFYTCTSRYLIMGQGNKLFKPYPLLSDQHYIADFDLADLNHDQLTCLATFNTDVGECLFNKKKDRFEDHQVLNVNEVILLARYIGANFLIVTCESGQIHMYQRKEPSIYSSWIKKEVDYSFTGSTIVDFLPHYPKRYECSVLTRDGKVHFVDVSKWLL